MQYLRARSGRKRRARVAVFTVALTAIAAGCSRGGDDATTAAAAPRPIKNCLFIILDAATATHFGAWGYERNTTPNIDAIAAEGFVFSNAHSQCGSTLPSTWSFLTGQYPLRPEGTELTPQAHRIRPGDLTLAEAFEASGFRTFGYSQNPYIGPTWGFQAGFGEFEQYSVVDDSTGTRNDVVAAEMFDEVREAIAAAERDGARWFGYLHYLRPHAPFTAPEPQGTRFVDADDPRPSDARNSQAVLKSLRREPISPEELESVVDSYDGGLAYADHEIGQLIEWLRESDILEDTLVIVASDHGEGFMQHGLIGHGYILFEEVLHVPLIFRAPEDSGLASGRSDALVEMIDVYPTVVELFGLEPPPYPLHGESLQPALRGEPLPFEPVAFAQTFYGKSISARLGDRKLIMNVSRGSGRFSNIGVFNIQDDPGEQNNLYPLHPVDDLLEAAAAYVRRWGHSSKPGKTSAGEVPEEIVDELEALGYLRE